MYITNKQLPRRTVLRGMGVAIGLPFLEAMVPAKKAWAAATTSPARFVAIEMVHGSAGATKIGLEKNLWAPAAEGKDFDLTPSSLLPLDPIREHLTIISNTDVRMAEAFSPKEIGADHFRSSATFLTQAHPRQTEGSAVFVGESMDQIIAKRIGGDRLADLLGSEPRLDTTRLAETGFQFEFPEASRGVRDTLTWFKQEGRL